VTKRAGLPWRLAALALPLLVIGHFGLVALTIAAPGLVPSAVQPAVAAYFTPVFAQDWRLFAPRPDVNDYSVYARGASRVEGRLETTPWLDLMEPLVVDVQANRLSPAGVRLEVVHKAAIFTMRAAGPLGRVQLGREALAESWTTIDRQPASLIVLERLASAALREAHPGRSFETVQVMVTSRPVGTGDGSVLLFQPVPFQEVTSR
jgi:hypothetical protein